jgi:hypothetical protein
MSSGFIHDEPVKKQTFPFEYDSNLLDELIITVSLTSQSEVDELIKYLRYQKNCFLK